MYFRFGDLGTANILRRPLVFSGSGQRLINKKKERHICFRVTPLLAALVTCFCAVKCKDEACTALAEVPEGE